ncbi:hypothetical protein D0862_15147 [Hortaea werneckii]|uniref:WHIM1 domain-containing protein n=1 Tax=Hortaea werneckii TaxID=91943 RepID=A0A3M7DRD8_HORWE|nr:hypothetical protein D0862_15147 [Hortaea werneckii]
MADDKDSDSSGLSSAGEEEIQKLAPIFVNAKKANKQRFPPPHVSPPRPKRPPSPPREEQFADNPDIAFLVMFRSRFNEAMPSKLSQMGPQDIERGVTDQPPSPQVESLLCALLALVLNRKKPVERGHHGRALEECISTMKPQWPLSWHGINPLHGPRDFTTMPPSERLNLLRTLVHWALTSSEAIQAIIKDRYKQQRHQDDENQPLSVQPWGIDGDKRRYFLIQGADDTTGFRIYRESGRYLTKGTASWINVGGDIEELKQLAAKLNDVDGSQAARRLAARMLNAVPTFEASEEKRRRKEYRQMKRAQFERPEPGFSLYEGRTRGKRLRYTYDDDDDMVFGGGVDSDATSTRRSARNRDSSARTTPFEASGPTFTASGRQINKPKTGEYGEPLLKSALENATDELAPELEDGATGTDFDSEPVQNGRATRAAGRSGHVNGVNGRKRKRVIDDDEDDEGEMSDEEGGDGEDDWDSDRNAEEEDDTEMPDADDEDSEDADEEAQSLVVKLKVSPQRATNGESKEVNGDGHDDEDTKPIPATKTQNDDAHDNKLTHPPSEQIPHSPPPPKQAAPGAESTSSTQPSSALPLNGASSNNLNLSTSAHPDVDPSSSAPYPTPATSATAAEKLPPSQPQSQDAETA